MFTIYLDQYFYRLASGSWHPVSQQGWMPHRSVFQSFAALMRKTGIWYDKAGVRSYTAKLLSVFLLLLLPFSQASADAPLVYSKTVITIVPAPELSKPQSNKKADDKKISDSKTIDLLPETRRVTKEFTVEVRPLSFLSEHDFIAHQPFTDKEGMMMLIDPPAPTQLKSSNLLGKVDVLFVLEDGIIDKIAPDLSLPELEEPLASDKPVRAFVFLKPGQAQASDIRPGDRVENPLFKTHPFVLQ